MGSRSIKSSRRPAKASRSRREDSWIRPTSASRSRTPRPLTPSRISDPSWSPHVNGAVLRVGDVATVVEGFPAPIGDAVINSGPGLMLIVEKQLGANTLTVTRGVEQALEQMKPALSGVAVDPTIFRPATFIEMSLHNLSRALLVGCVLVILVLMVFLADWRTALISSIAIPLSLLAAGLLLHYRGGTLDTMVLAGSGHRAWRGRRRRDYRCREHREAASPQSSGGASATSDPGRP